MIKKRNNPFRIHKFLHYYLTYERLSKIKKRKKILDLGCGRGEFIGNIQKLNLQPYGFDVNASQLESARKKFPHVKYYQKSVGSDLPFKNNFFDIVVMFHVLEHVDSEERIMTEIKRVLKKNGKLFVASPYRGIFTWADTANLRFRFPRLHKFFLTTFLGYGEYKKRFVDQKKDKIFGDCSANRHWHKHYKETQVRELLTKNGFKITKFEKFSLFHPFLLVLDNIYNYFSKSNSLLLMRLIWLDNHLKMKECSYNMLVTAIKRS